MNGLWKEAVGGWNHKDSKRKRQSRKHTLKDKGRALLNAYDSFRRGIKKENADIFRQEGASDRSCYTTREFLYNKPLYSHTRYSFYCDGARRKYGQKLANKMSRNNCKKWIRNGDFDKEIKNHPYEKSIAWLIH